LISLDSRVRGNDENREVFAFYEFVKKRIFISPLSLTCNVPKFPFNHPR
jgi:hypothetical protein